MGVSEHEPSIRIEQDHAVPDTGPSTQGSRDRGFVAAAVVLLLVVLAGFLALRPDQGQSADGTQRQATTTTVVEPTTTTTTTTPPEPLAAAFVDVEGSISEIVTTDSGYLALLDEAAPRESPPFASSINGVRWTRLETPLVIREEDNPRRSPVAEFIGLRTTDVGLSVLRTRRLRVDTNTFVVDRLVSPDAITWTIDEQFSEVFVEQAVTIPSGGDDVILSVSGPLPGIRLPTETSEFRLIDEDGASESYSGVGLLSDPHLLEGMGVVAALGLQIPAVQPIDCLLYTSPSPRDRQKSRMPSSA